MLSLKRGLPVALAIAAWFVVFGTVTFAVPHPRTKSALWGDGAACDLCHNTVHKLMDFVENNETEVVVEDLLIGVCLAAGPKIHQGLNFEVCDGFVREFGFEVLHVLSYRLLNATEVCSYFSLCPHVNVSFGHETYDKWIQRLNNEMKTMHIEPRTGSCDTSSVGHFLHLSDAHVDQHYKVGSNAECDEPLCCRSGTGTGSAAAGPWGHYNCDIKFEMADVLLRDAAAKKPDFVVYTGDSPPHDDWQVGEGMTYEEAQRDQYNGSVRIAGLFKDYFVAKGIPVFPSVGNHEEFPVDQFPGPPQNSPLMTTLADVWAPFLPKAALTTVRIGGYYTTTVAETVEHIQATRASAGVSASVEDLRIVALNTMYCDALNFFLIKGIPDPAGQLEWLESVLSAAEDAGEDVFILGHIPPGNTGCLPVYSRTLNAILERYAHTIAAQIYGHTHKDEFEVMWSMNNNDGLPYPDAYPVGSVFIGASMTTYTNINPSYSYVQYCREQVQNTGGDIRILDLESFATNLTEANLHPNDEPAFPSIYKFKETYKLEDVSPSSLAKLAARIRDDEETAMTYVFHYRAGSEAVTSCDEKCRLEYSCAANYTVINAVDECSGASKKSLKDYMKEILNKLC